MEPARRLLQQQDIFFGDCWPVLSRWGLSSAENLFKDKDIHFLLLDDEVKNVIQGHSRSPRNILTLYPLPPLPSSPSIFTLVNHFWFARESSVNIRIFSRLVKDSLQARQRRFPTSASAVPRLAFSPKLQFFQKRHQTFFTATAGISISNLVLQRLGSGCPA